MNFADPSTLESRGIAADQANLFVAASLGFTLLVVGGIVFWVPMAIRRVRTASPSAVSHVRWMGIVVAVLGVLGLLTEGLSLGGLKFMSRSETVLSIVAVLTVLVSVVTLTLAFLLFRLRNAVFASPTSTVASSTA